MKTRASIASLAFFLAALLLPLSGRAVNIMVNEIFNGTGNVVPGTRMVSDEYIEFLITEQTTSAQLASMTFGDVTSNLQQFSSVFQFDKTTLDSVLSSAGVSAFMPGTLITVKGAGRGAQNLTYNPGAISTNSDAWGIELVAGQGAKAVVNPLINGNLDIDRNGDIVWIAAPGPSNNTDVTNTQFISALGTTGNQNGNNGNGNGQQSFGRIADAVIAQLGSGVLTSGRADGGSSIVNNGTALNPSATVTGDGSFGIANPLGTNTVFITGLRVSSQNVINAIPEPSRALLILAGLGAALFTRRRRTVHAC